MPSNPQSYGKLSASPFKSKRGGMGVVSCCRLLSVRFFVLEVQSWAGSDVPVNLYQKDIILCSDRKGSGPKAQLSPSKVPVLEFCF